PPARQPPAAAAERTASGRAGGPPPPPPGAVPRAGGGYNGAPRSSRPPPDMIVLEGQPALSPFRRERLETRLQALSPGIRVTGAWHVYWVEPATDADALDCATLHRILRAGGDAAPREQGAVSRYVAPRLGTISPWASKATELLQGAGLEVKRVERGMRIDVAGWPRDEATTTALAGLLHDPMTQSLLASHDEAGALFRVPARGELERIPLDQLEEANARLGLALADDEVDYLRTRF